MLFEITLSTINDSLTLAKKTFQTVVAGTYSSRIITAAAATPASSTTKELQNISLIPYGRQQFSNNFKFKRKCIIQK